MAGSKKALGILFGVKGGSRISADSGKLILQDLTKIVNQINNNQKLLPKVVLQIDTSKSINNINQLHKALKNLQQQAQYINISGGGGGSGKGGGGNKTSSGFDSSERIKAIKEYLASLVEMRKAIAKGGVHIDESTGEFKHLNQSYAARVKLANQLREAVEALGIEISKESGLIIKPEPKELSRIAQSLGITIEEFEKFYETIEKEGLKASGKIEKNSQSIVNSSSKQVRNARQEVLRMYDTIAKDPSSKKIANEILKMTQSGTVNIDRLTDAMNRFRTAVAESGADVETWGQKFKKAFANQVRSALASLITVDLGAILKGVYDNVVALDDAVVNLQIASGKSRSETKALVKEYASLAKQLKATTAEVAASADTWLRQGYDAKEAQTLITNSMMLSKLGQIESEEAATALTSAMKGYKVAVEDSVNIVDKLTAVDMEAAASAGGIATAMAETAAGAGLAGVSMDKLIGYLAVVKEVSQDADESVGKRIAQQHSNVLQVGNNIGQRPEVAETEVTLYFYHKKHAA